MKVKDLLGSQDVSSYNSCDILEWEGEFKHIPHRYFEAIISSMYSVPAIGKVSFIVINFKKEIYKRIEGRGTQCTYNI